MVANDIDVFAVDSARFLFLTAVQLPERLRYLRCSDVSGVLTRFEFLRIRPVYQRRSEYGELGRCSFRETLSTCAVRIEDIFSRSLRRLFQCDIVNFATSTFFPQRRRFRLPIVFRRARG